MYVIVDIVKYGKTLFSKNLLGWENGGKYS